jgi:aspartyl-tRNA(Asn)/glutamyl-tRNA(Gln) amidotransferase subunit A
MTDWIERPLSAIAAGLQRGQVTATQLAEEAIDNHQQSDAALQAYKSWDGPSALEQAAAADKAFAAGADLGALQGIPFSVKDIFGVAGFPIFAGSPKRLPTEWEAEGAMVRAIRSQLAVIPGKTHSVEFAFGGLGTNPHWGAPRNPWDAVDHRAPGGSSAGAGVSLCEGSALVAFGTDTGGSVRVPASMTGNVGLKTTKGRWPTDGITPLSSTFDTPGILTRSAADAALAFTAIESALRGRPAPAIEPLDIRGLKIGLTGSHFWDRCQDDIAAVLEDAIAEISAAGAATLEIAFPEAIEAAKTMGAGAVVAAEGFASLKQNLPDWIETLDPMVGARMEDGRKAKATDYVLALARMADLAASAAVRLEAVDILAVPTVPLTPPKIADVADPDAYNRAIPAGLDQAGMPVGLQLISKSGDDIKLLAAGLAIERVLGEGKDRLGPVPSYK